MTLAIAKEHLRLSGNDLDTEVQGLIDGAKADLRLVGIVLPEDRPPPSVTTLDSDNDPSQDPQSTSESPEPTPASPLIGRAIILYCKAHFGFIKDSEKYAKAYEGLKQQLRLSTEYTTPHTLGGSPYAVDS